MSTTMPAMMGLTRGTFPAALGPGMAPAASAAGGPPAGPPADPRRAAADVYDNTEQPFSLFDHGLPAGQAQEEAMQRSTHLQATPLSRRFFSRANVDRLQRAIRHHVRRAMGLLIDRQSDEQLLIVMRYVFMQSARHHGCDDEIARLNALVLREVVPQVGSGAAQYLAYLRDASTMHVPMARGVATSLKGTKTTQLFRGL